jgi:GH15 family glucan-1,4-alpha-glucosidase
MADNLVDIANSDSVYVFRNRSAYNDYFKYNKRSAAQKAVLDEFWDKNSAVLQQPAQQRWEEKQREEAAKNKSN